MGRTQIQKFEDCANECCYAFALFTPDDFVKKEWELQAQSNLLFEIGWFYGRLGPQRVSILKKADTVIPSDLKHLVTLDFKEDVRETYYSVRRIISQATQGQVENRK